MTTPPPDSGRLLLLDGHSLAYRAFFALPVENFATSAGQPTNAVYGFTSMLINALRDERPTHLAVAFDVSRQTFRAERYPSYKATRSATPDEFRGQVPLIKDVLDAMGITTVEVPGYEADDVLATLATGARDAGLQVLIVTGDRDALQLVGPDTTVLYPRRGVSELDRYTPDAVEAKYGVPPQRYPDLAALVGESSDNLPGVPGVGPGFAAKWLQQYGDLDGVLAHADQIAGKKGESLRAHIEQVRLNRELNALVSDLALPVGVADLRLADIDRDAVHRTFDALEFRVLRDRLFEVLGDRVAAPTGAGPAVAVEVIDLAGAPADWLARNAADPTATAGIAYRCDSSTGALTAIAVAGRPGVAGFLDLTADPSADAEAALSRWLADDNVPKCVHDGKPLMRASAARGWTVGRLVHDTILGAYLVLPGQRGFSLPDLVARFLHRELDVAGAPTQAMLFDDDSARSAELLAEEAVAVADLAAALTGQLVARSQLPLLTDLELPLMRVLADMEHVGIAVDVPALTGLERHFEDRMRAAESQAHGMAGHAFNLGSPKQLQQVLFEERGLPKTKRIKTGYTTDAEALTTLYSATGDRLLEVLLEWRDASKLRQTVAGLLPLVDEQRRIHTTFQQTIAATGRLSSSDPNLQNIPVRTAEGRRIRAAFIPGAGYDALVTADYSQIEMRIMAHLSGDAGLIEAFRSGEDLHTTVAAAVFSCSRDEVDAERRRRIKAMSYGLAYGLSAFGLSQQLGIPPDEARRLMDDYFLRFGGVRDYLHEVVERARAEGYTETMFGRRRYLPDLTSDNRQRREMAERMALNSPIQGSAADIIKRAMIDVHSHLGRAGLRSRMLLQVHDELVLEIVEEERGAVIDLVRSTMAGAADLSVPLDVSIGVGRDWDDAAH